MALDSVFANSPTSVGARNKETLKHDGGEKESWQEECSDHSDVIKDHQNLTSVAMDDDDDRGEGGGGEVEEGEIVESDNEIVAQMNVESGEKTAGDVGKSLTNRKKKKKKKKRKKPGDADGDKNETAGQVENKKPKKSTKKGNWYVDHDRVDDEDQWFKNNNTTNNTTSTNQNPNKKSQQNFNGEYESPGEDFDTRHGVENNRQQQNGPTSNTTSSNKSKKRKGSGGGGGSDKKRSKTSRQNFSNGKNRRRDMRHRTICKFFLEGKCNKGAECTFLHDGTPAKKFELCKFYLNGFCAKAEKCLFMHKEFPCKFFHTGVKCYSAEQCKFSHEPLTDETRKMLDRCLDANRDDDFRPNSPTSKGRPSLLGSPPRHVKEMADTIRKIPSLFDIHVGTPTSNTPMPSPPQLSPSQTVRPNFYSDTMKSPTFSGRMTEPKSPRDNNEMSTSESKEDSKEKGDDNELPMKDVDMRRFSDMSDTADNHSGNDDDDDKRVDKCQSSEDSESDSSKRTPPAPIAIPTHLPKKQRELFLRIQQQQRQAENSESDKNDDKKEEDELDKDENWYTSDDDDDNDGDQPLTAVLKKLQQQPPPPSNKPTSTPPVFDIAKMIGMICNNNKKKSVLDSILHRPDDRFPDLNLEDRDMRIATADTRDPRKRRMQRVDPRSDASRFVVDQQQQQQQRDSWTKDSVKEPRIRESRFEPRFVDQQRPKIEPFRDAWDNADKDMRLVGNVRSCINTNFTPEVVDNYAAIPYKLQAMTISSPNYIDIMMSMSMSNPNDPRLQNDPRLKKQPVEVPEDDGNLIVDVRSKFPALSQNGKMSSLLGSPPRDLLMPTLPPIILPPVEPPNPYLVTPAPPKPTPIRPCRPDPRQNRNLGRHSGLPDTISEKVSTSENLRTDSLSTVSKNSETDTVSNKAKPKGGSYQRRGSLDYASPLGFKDDNNSSTGNSYSRRPQHRRTSTLSKTASTTDVAVKSPPRVAAAESNSNMTNDVDVSKVDDTSTKIIDVGESGIGGGGENKMSDLADTSTSTNVSTSEINCNVVDASASLKDVFKTIDPTASPFC